VLTHSQSELVAVAGPIAVVLAVTMSCSFANRLGNVLGVVDHPDDGRKAHAAPTPLVGGIALMLPLIIYAFAEAAWAVAARPVFVALAFASSAALLVGFLDDRRGLSARARLFASAAAATVAILIEPNLRLDWLDFGWGWILPLGVFALPLTLLSVVGLQNAINMADGKNGLVVSLSIVWTVAMLMHAPVHLRDFLILLLVGLAILLFFNLRGRVFLGDSGTYSIGIVFGLLAIYIYHSADGRLPMMTAALWFLIPVIDCLRLIVERLWAGRSPLAPDCCHLHHLLERQWRWPRGLAVYLALAAVPGFVASLWPGITMPLMALALLGYAVTLCAVRWRALASLRSFSSVSMSRFR
jgi:UDP-GlcNAc:undecaprenyl-phosphate/decaprenyl-phosphate GlcNAc-1-phosphate transferase